MARLAVLLLLAAGCNSQALRENQQAWREAECDQAINTPQRERCLAEARRYDQEQKKPRN
jgi:hypothetical protein